MYDHGCWQGDLIGVLRPPHRDAAAPAEQCSVNGAGATVYEQQQHTRPAACCWLAADQAMHAQYGVSYTGRLPMLGGRCS